MAMYMKRLQYIPRQTSIRVLAIVGCLLFLSLCQWFYVLSHEHSVGLSGLGKQHEQHEQDPALPGLADVCQNETKWIPNLWLKCVGDGGLEGQAIQGGLTNARNAIALCIRQAIDVGATGILISGVSGREPGNPTNTHYGSVCLDEYWDMGFLNRTLGTACPRLQIKICDDVDSFLNANDVKVYQGPTSADDVPEKHYRGSVRAAFVKKFPLLELNDEYFPARPIVVEVAHTIYSWDWARSNETETLRVELSQTLRYARQIKGMAERILAQNERLARREFTAVHLRGENDWPQEWGSLTEQVQRYAEWLGDLRRGNVTNVTDVYVSCGNRDAIQGLREKVDRLGMGYAVHDKWSLLDSMAVNGSSAGGEHMLDGLGFDHQGAIEYEVMMRSKMFARLSTSTLSLLTAFSRTSGNTAFWDEVIYANSTLMKGQWSMIRDYRTDDKTIRGHDGTYLLVVSGPDMMAYFP